MAGSKINSYAIGNSDIENVMTTLDKVFVGVDKITITEMHTAVVPEIAAGSIVECAGSYFIFNSNEAISTTDPYTSLTVVDGTVYIITQPSGSTITAAFTATAPTWSDAKQGWYGTGAQANAKYVPFQCTKAGTAYSSKYYVYNDFSTRNFVIASDATERQVTSTSYVTDTNLNLIIDAKEGDIWDILTTGKYRVQNASFGGFVTIAITSGTGVLYVDSEPDFGTGVVAKYINNGSYASVEPSRMIQRAVLKVTSSGAITINMKMRNPNSGQSIWAKDREYYAKKLI